MGPLLGPPEVGATLTLLLFMEGEHTLSRNRGPWYSLGYLLVVVVLILVIILLVQRLV